VLIDMRKLLVAVGFAKSKCEAMRLIKQGSVKIDGRKINSHLAYYEGGKNESD
jgi:ribosomal protein S4